jgi:hypothetical protein
VTAANLLNACHIFIKPDTGGEPHFQAHLKERNVLSLYLDSRFGTGIKPDGDPGYASSHFDRGH